MKNSLIINAIKTLVSAILGIILLNLFNVFDHLSFVPSDIKYKVGMTTYFPIIDLVLLAILSKIDEKFYTKIECIFYNRRNGANPLENPIINFNEDIAKISVKISAAGHSSRLRKISIKLIMPDWITIQTDSNVVSVADDTHSCILKLDKMIPESKKSERGTATVDLLFIRDSKDLSYTLAGEFEGSSWLEKTNCNFISNYVEIKP